MPPTPNPQPNGRPRAEVQNAADRDQVRRAKNVERDVEEMRTLWYRDTLSTYAGRAVLWDILEKAGVYRSIWSPNVEIHYRAGRQDFGHELIAFILETDDGLYEQMEREARARKRQRDRSTDAAVPRTVVEDQGVSDGRTS